MKSITTVLAAALLISTTALRPDATDDLFAAIERESVEDVKKALDAGADINKIRESDKKSPRTLAWQKVIFGTAIPTAVASLATGITTTAAACYQSKWATSLGLGSLALGSYLQAEEQNCHCDDEDQPRSAWSQKLHDILHSIDHIIPRQCMTTFQTIGLSAIALTAAASDAKKLKVTSLAGLATLGYLMWKSYKQQAIWQAINEKLMEHDSHDELPDDEGLDQSKVNNKLPDDGFNPFDDPKVQQDLGDIVYQAPEQSTQQATEASA